MPIDTLKASKRLKELGFDPDQAEGLADLLSDLDVASATKEDLDDAEDRLLQRIADVEKRLNQRIDHLDSRIDRLDARIDEVEENLTQRIDEVEEGLNQRIDEVKTDLNSTEERLRKEIIRRSETLEAELKKYVMNRLGWGAGLLAVWIALFNYLMG